MQDSIRPRIFLLGSIALALIVAFLLGRLTVSPRSQTPPEAARKSVDVVEVTDAALDLMKIKIGRVVKGNVSAEVIAPATVSSAVTSQAVITAHVAGTVSRVNKRLGESVKTGEVLALVASGDAAALAADRRAAEAKETLARSIVKREQELFEQHVTPRQDLEAAQAQLAAADAEAARARQAADTAHVWSDGKSVAVTSPIAGVVTEAHAALGAFVEPEAELFHVADPRFVTIAANVPARDALQIHSGDSAEVLTNEGAHLAAVVSSITPAVDSRTNTATALLALQGDERPPMPGAFVRARIVPRGQAETELVVPEEAIQILDGREVVFVRAPKGFVIRPVTVGVRGGGRAAVRQGVSEADEIATQNAFLLKAEAGKGAEDEE